MVIVGCTDSINEIFGRSTDRSNMWPFLFSQSAHSCEYSESTEISILCLVSSFIILPFFKKSPLHSSIYMTFATSTVTLGAYFLKFSLNIPTRRVAVSSYFFLSVYVLRGLSTSPGTPAQLVGISSPKKASFSNTPAFSVPFKTELTRAREYAIFIREPTPYHASLHLHEPMVINLCVSY